MIKPLLFLLLWCSLAHSKQYNPDVLAIEAKLFPKIAMLEQHVKQRSSDALKMTIFAIEADYEVAVSLKNMMVSMYPEGILNRQLIVTIEKSLSASLADTDAVIALSHPEDQLLAIASWANQLQIPSFVYDSYHLRYGFLVSIYFGKSIKPLLNKRISHDYDFIFDQYFLNLVKFYD